MRLLDNRKRVRPVFSPELVTAARLILIGLVLITQVKYQVCRIFIVQFEEPTQDRQLTLRAGVCPWINGFFGIGGFYLCCVANFDAARAEVVFGRGNKQENKAAFDSLYTHKAEIESSLGTTLQWNRGDDIKSSKVFIQLNNVSIENETDWLQMANFHADWTKKFYDVIVPYIKG